MWKDKFAKTLSRHEKTHTKESFTCGQCDVSFKTKQGLQEHTDRVHSSILHPCAQCKKSFTCKANLKTHIQTHNIVEKTFECEYCDKKFVEPFQTRKHISVQTISSLP